MKIQTKIKMNMVICGGADTFILTKEMIEALLSGKCIAGDNGEYVTFIEME